MKLTKNKRAVVDQLQGLIVGLVALGIIIAIAFLITAEVGSNSQVTADTNATRALNTVEGAMADIPDWVPIVVITLIGALLIGLVAIFRRR